MEENMQRKGSHSRSNPAAGPGSKNVLWEYHSGCFRLSFPSAWKGKRRRWRQVSGGKGGCPVLEGSQNGLQRTSSSEVVAGEYVSWTGSLPAPDNLGFDAECGKGTTGDKRCSCSDRLWQLHGTPCSCVGAEFAVPDEVQGLAKLSLEVHILSAVREQIGLET